MLWFIHKQVRRIARKFGLKVGAISPYDFYDWKTPWASQAEIERDRQEYIALNRDSRFELHRKNEHIIRFLRHIQSEHGIAYIPTYVRDLWAAKRVCYNKPSVHYDCGSSFSGFITHLIPMGVPIVLIDIRDLTDKFNTSLFDNIMGGGGGKLPPI